jgi:2-polyprenyl-6-methoxyphenol hydroxylase-like FAD-dependent oxidoreductase
LNPKENHTDILISGAGPTGLTLACELAYRNINFRIIDKKESFSQYSGAMLIHSRTMEFLDRLGIAQKILNRASVIRNIEFLFGTKKRIAFNVSGNNNEITLFPGIVKIKQPETEKILSDFLLSKGYKVEHSSELLNFSQNESFVISKVQCFDKEEYITSKYLIGADGAHSTIRKQLSIPFKGKTFPVSLFVMDCNADINLSSEKIHFLFSKNISAGFFALDKDKWRIDGCIQNSTGMTDNSIDEVEKILISNNLLDSKITPISYSLIELNQRIALSMRQDRVLLAGDAAHVHSPAGAQGMNTGMHDAVNLGWKLALLILGKATPALLNSYSDERHSEAEKVVRSTYKPFMVAVSTKSTSRFFRLHILSRMAALFKILLEHSYKTQHFVFNNLSGIGISYTNNSLTNGASNGNFNKLAPKPGDRWPFYIQYQSKYFILFSFTRSKTLEYLIKNKYSDIIHLEFLNEPEKYKLLDISDDGFFLIRPDNFVAYRSKTIEIDSLENYLNKFLC